jgi:hypothetical protein
METARMIKRTFVTFKAAFPDEAQWTEHGSLLVPDGRSISRCVAGALRSAGLCPSEVTQYSFYGWAFQIVLPKLKAWCLLQGGDPWLLLVKERKRGLRWLFGSARSDELALVLRAIDTALRQDARFSSIRWFTRDEYESGCQGGAASPV